MNSHVKNTDAFLDSTDNINWKKSILVWILLVLMQFVSQKHINYTSSRSGLKYKHLIPRELHNVPAQLES